MCHYQNSFCNNPPQQCTKCSTVHQQSPKKRLCKQSENLKTLIRRVIIFQFAFSSSRCCFRAFTLEDETLDSKYLQLALAFSESITFFSLIASYLGWENPLAAWNVSSVLTFLASNLFASLESAVVTMIARDALTAYDKSWLMCLRNVFDAIHCSQRNCSKDESLLQSVKISNLNNIGCKVFTNYACESEWFMSFFIVCKGKVVLV